MPLPVRKSYKGSPVTTSLTALLGVGSTSCTVNSVTGWPTTFPFYVVIEPSTSREEKVRVTGITGTTLTVVRAQDNTIDVEHAAASTVYPVFTAIEADEANQIASAMTTKGDLITTDGSTINRLAVGATNTHVLQVDSTQTNGIKWGQVATAGIADSAVTSAKIADGTIVDGDINASAAIALSKLATGALPSAITVASANIVDGTIVNADINASAAIAHTKLANITAGSVLMGNASNAPTATALSGDVTVNSSGVTAIGSGVIVDADVNASAAIALSKLATGALPSGITVASTNIVNGTIVLGDLAAALQEFLVPVGSINAWSTNTAPAGWQLCDGTAVSRTTYAALFAVIGETYGAGDGSTTFNLPNLKGRAIVGRDSSQTEFDTLAETGGAKTVTLSSSEIPSHTHTITHDHGTHSHSASLVIDSAGSHNHTLTVTSGALTAASGTAAVGITNESLNTTGTAGTHSHSSTLTIAASTSITFTGNSGPTGGGGAHNNLQPYIVLNYIIKH